MGNYFNSVCEGLLIGFGISLIVMVAILCMKSDRSPSDPSTVHRLDTSTSGTTTPERPVFSSKPPYPEYATVDGDVWCLQEGKQDGKYLFLPCDGLRGAPDFTRVTK